MNLNRPDCTSLFSRLDDSIRCSFVTENSGAIPDLTATMESGVFPWRKVTLTQASFNLTAPH
jgi:hypothetical protein